MFLLHKLQEVDLSPGPFILDYERNEAAERAGVYSSINIRILSSLAGLKEELWSFAMPLTPLVWAAILTALLGVLIVLQLLPLSMPGTTFDHSFWPTRSAYSCVRVILQQGEASGTMFSHSCLHVRVASYVLCSQGTAAKSVRTNSLLLLT